jgi:hypothetical protein
MRRHRLIVVTELILAAALGAAVPALAPSAGAHAVAGRDALSCAVSSGQYPRLVIVEYLMPDRVGLDKPHLSAGLPPVQLPVLAMPGFPVRR